MLAKARLPPCALGALNSIFPNAAGELRAKFLLILEDLKNNHHGFKFSLSLHHKEMHSVHRVGMPLGWLCFALHYWNAGWIWGCPSAVVTAAAQRLLCSMKWPSLFFSSFFSFSSCIVWFRGNTISAIFFLLRKGWFCAVFGLLVFFLFHFWNRFLALTNWNVTRGKKTQTKRSEVWPLNILSR